MRLTVYGFVIFLITICPGNSYSSPEKLPTSNQQTVSSINDYNVIIIAISTLRADHLGCYGYHRPTSPNIDKLGGVVFEQAISQSNWTLPSITSLFTSKHVITHSVNSRDRTVGRDELMLAEILKFYGYKTAAFTGGLDLKSIYNLNQGFDLYYDEVAEAAMGGWKEAMPKALDWLTGNKESNFFLFLHTYDVHQPYHYPKPYENLYGPDYKGVVDELFLDYNFLKKIKKDKTVLEKDKSLRLTQNDINHIIDHYDGGITYVDGYIGELLTKLDDLALMDKTIIILTADHGEALFDHGSFDRYGANNLYEEIIHVPLIIRHPKVGAKGKSVQAQVQLIDVMPTVLDFLNIPAKAEAQGRSLAPLLESKPGPIRYAFSQGRGKKWSLRTGKWKLIHLNNEFELYDREKDPREQRNLSNEHPDKVYELYLKYLQWYKAAKNKNSAIDNRIILPEDAINKLKEAGYW